MTQMQAALCALLVLGLLWAALGYWLTMRPVGDDPGALLDALQPAYDFADLPDAPARGRDYSGDRGPVPQPRPRFASLYDELVSRLGDPLGA